MSEQTVTAPASEVSTQPAATAPAAGDWKASLPEDIRTRVDKFDSVETLAKSFVNAESLIGREKIPMPKTPEEYLNTFRRLGAKESANDYNIKPHVELPEGFDVGDMTWYKEAAAKLGLTESQAQGLFATYLDQNLAGFKSVEEKRNAEYDAAVTALKAEWGADFDRRVNEANRVIERVGGKPLVEMLKAKGLDNDPEMTKVFASLASAVLEDGGMVGGGQATTIGGLDEQIKDIDAQLASIVKQHKGMAGTLPEYQRLSEKRTLLYQRRYPEPATRAA